MINKNFQNNEQLESSLFLENINSLVEQRLAQEGFEIAWKKIVSQSGRQVFRFFIDKLEFTTKDEESQFHNCSVNLDDCAFVSRIISKIIEDKVLEDSFLEPDSYVIEVSSPGLDRPLVKEKDYKRFQGQEIKIKLLQNEKNITYQGVLGQENNTLILTQENGEKVSFQFNEVVNAKLLISKNLFKK